MSSAETSRPYILIRVEDDRNASIEVKDLPLAQAHAILQVATVDVAAKLMEEKIADGSAATSWKNDDAAEPFENGDIFVANDG